MLEIRSLTKCYSSIPAVDHVSFTIRPGEVLGYLGPNGSGKSTTVKIITGLLEQTTGTVTFRGSNINDDLTAYKRLVGYVPEEANLYPFLSGLESDASSRDFDQRKFVYIVKPCPAMYL